MLFWILTLLTVFAVTIIVLRPLFGDAGNDATDEDHLRISIYRENLNELDAEHQRGQLDDSQLKNVKHELELSLLHEAAQAQQNPGTVNSLAAAGGNHRGTAIILAVLIFAGVFMLYQTIGNPQLNDLKKFSDAVAEGTQEQIPPLDNMLAALERHLRKNPEDSNGWLLLANAYSSVGEFDKSANAYQRLYSLTGDQPEVLLGYVNALVRSNDGSFSEQATRLLQRLLEIDPDNYTALFFSGLAAEEKGNYQLANNYYRKILPILRDNPELLQTVNALITKNEQLDPASGSSGDDTAADSSSDPGPVASVALRVSVADELQGRFDSDDTLFIYATSLEGSPMPLAVIRTRAGELPMDAILDDSMAMMPAMKLSGFDKVKVQARISKTGNAESQPGDLSGVIDEVDVIGTEPVTLVIDTVLP